MYECQKLTTIRENAINTRLDVWLDRLRMISSNAGRDEILDCTLDAAISIGRAEMGNVQLFDRKRHVLEIHTQHGFSRPFLDFFQSIRGDSNTACSMAFKKGRSIKVEDITESSIFSNSQGLEMMLDAGVRSVLSTPLIARTGRVLGIVSIHYRQPHHYSESDVERLNVLARVAGSMIEQAYNSA